MDHISPLTGGEGHSCLVAKTLKNYFYRDNSLNCPQDNQGEALFSSGARKYLLNILKSTLDRYNISKIIWVIC